MKRKDFLRKMRNRRRGGTLEERQPEIRRRVDWRTLRVDLPGPADATPAPDELPVGLLLRLPDGIRLEATSPCWVRGYRHWLEDDTRRAEFQYRPVESGAEPPPGAIALTEGDTWQPPADD